MPTVITNTDLNTKAAAIPAPYGPLVRVGVAPDFDPNNEMRVEFTSALGVTVYLSYEDLDDRVRWMRILEDAHSQAGLNVKPFRDLMFLSEVVYRLAASIEAANGTPPYTNGDMATLVDLLRTNPLLIALPPNRSDMPKDVIRVDFNVVDAGSLAADVTNLTTGKVDIYMWDWGDGTYSFGSNPPNKTYGSNGQKTITLTAVGAGGIDRRSKQVTLA